jgi:hypothetical protein
MKSNIGTRYIAGRAGKIKCKSSGEGANLEASC